MEKGRFFRSHMRALAFGVVLVIITGLVLSLFRDASAVEMTILDPPATLTGSTSFDVQVKIDKGQRLPIQSIEAVVERLDAPGSKTGAQVQARAVCVISPVPGFGCPRDAPLSTPDGDASIQAIRFVGARTSQGGGAQLGYTDIFGSGPLSGTTTGYGFDPQTGYGARTGGPTPFNGGVGYGYGVGTTTLYLRFDVRVETCTTTGLAPGFYSLTVLAHLGLDATIGDLSSPYTAFRVTCDGITGTNAPAPKASTTAQTVTPPLGASASYHASIPSAAAGQTITLTLPDPLLRAIDLVPSEALVNAQVRIHRWPASQAPPNLQAPAADAVGYVEVLLQSGLGALQTARLHLVLDAEQADDPDRLLLLRAAQAEWTLAGRIDLVLSDDGRFTGAATGPCCDAFAIVFDHAAPQVRLDLPPTVAGTFRIDPMATDNLGLGRVRFFLDDFLIGETTTAPHAIDLDTTRFANGDHVLRVVALDWTERATPVQATLVVKN